MRARNPATAPLHQLACIGHYGVARHDPVASAQHAPADLAGGPSAFTEFDLHARPQHRPITNPLQSAAAGTRQLPATDGIIDASNKIQAVAASCPDTKIVLGGYSQGAAVAGYTTTDTVPAGFNLPAGLTGPMPVTVAPHIAAVVLFGTPDPWMLGLVDQTAPPITIGQLYTAWTLQLCATGDPVCFPGGLDRSAHSSYKVNGIA